MRKAEGSERSRVPDGTRRSRRAEFVSAIVAGVTTRQVVIPQLAEDHETVGAISEQGGIGGSGS